MRISIRFLKDKKKADILCRESYPHEFTIIGDKIRGRLANGMVGRNQLFPKFMHSYESPEIDLFERSIYLIGSSMELDNEVCETNYDSLDGLDIDAIYNYFEREINNFSSDLEFSCSRADHCFNILINTDFLAKQNVECTSCHSLFAPDNKEKEHKRLCNNCLETTRYGLLNYSYAPPVITFVHYDKGVRIFTQPFVNKKPKLFLGLENEVFFKKPIHDNMEKVYSKLGLYSYFKSDSSINKSLSSLSYNDGAEIVTFPMSVEFILNVLAKDIKILNKLCHVSELTGLHIHVSRTALSLDQLENIIKFFNNNPRYCKRMFGRESSRYCEWHIDKLNAGLREMRKHSNGIKHCPEVVSRNCVINLCKPNTIEFRGFAGTNNGRTVIKNLIFIAALVGLCETSVPNQKTVTRKLSKMMKG